MKQKEPKINKLFKTLLLLGFAALLPVLSINSWAVIETYEFADNDNRKRYYSFVDELRCPKCQNQNLAGSNSPIAKDLRRELHRLIEEGSSDDNIKQFMVKRYGNFVLYKPPVDKNTIIIWAAPAILGFIAVFVALLFRSRQARADKGLKLTVEEEKDLAAVLKKYS